MPPTLTTVPATAVLGAFSVTVTPRGAAETLSPVAAVPEAAAIPPAGTNSPTAATPTVNVRRDELELPELHEWKDMRRTTNHHLLRSIADTPQRTPPICTTWRPTAGYRKDSFISSQSATPTTGNTRDSDTHRTHHTPPSLTTPTPPQPVTTATMRHPATSCTEYRRLRSTLDSGNFTHCPLTTGRRYI